ncbi:MAG: response regulator [Ilumatobacteraceae bacterium]|nr:response regulator [Acidimicrobiales bacterium]MCB9393324.1 response regulator [Acidimicrobiaceae bacterium]
MADGHLRAAPASAGRARPIRVFVVDDHPAFLRTVAFVIEATPGFALAGTAETGLDALDVLAVSADIDLVLLDVNLPDVSGIEVARHRAAAGGHEVVVLMSTADLADLPSDVLEREAAAFLPKEQLTIDRLRSLWAAAGRPA